MPNFLSLWHGVQDPSYSYSWTTWDSQGNVTFAQQAIDNAWAAWYRYNMNGWSDAAIAAVVGMQAWESGINPWRWQNNVTLAYTDTTGRYDDTINGISNTHGYGLPQWTPQAVYSDPVGYFQRKGETIPSNWASFYSSSDFQASFSPHYSDVVGNAKDGDAQCQLINFLGQQSYFYFRRGGTQNPRHYTYGYMPFADFKTANIGDYYSSGDTNSDYPNYYITLDILIYQWLNNFGRGASETPMSTAVRLSAATQLYTLYTGSPPPVPPTPRRRKMPLWMMLRPMPY